MSDLLVAEPIDCDAVPDSAIDSTPTGNAVHESVAAHGTQVIAGYKVHPAAALFPLLEGEDLERLIASIKENGQREPVDLQGDELVEGRNRAISVGILKARGVKIELLTTQWRPQPGQTVAQYVMDKNLHRRHLTADQRAQIGTSLLAMIEKETSAAQVASQIKPGESRNPGGRKGKGKDKKADTKTLSPSERTARNRAKAERSTVGKLAAATGLTKHQASRAIKIAKHARQEDVAAVREGRKKAKDVAKTLKQANSNRKGSNRTPKPIDHPYEPHSELEREALKVWIAIFKKPFGIADKDDVLATFKAIRKAEQAGTGGVK
jgi:hypothetical protein